MGTNTMSLVAASMISASLAKDVAQLLREGEISDSLAKELELVRVGEVWEMMFFGTPVTILSYTGKTAGDTVTFKHRGEEATLPLPVFLGSNMHPSLKEENDDEETTTTQTGPTEQDETPDGFSDSKLETFGFKKARKILRAGYAVIRPKWDFSIIYDGKDLVAVGRDAGSETYRLTADDIFADDWQWG